MEEDSMESVERLLCRLGLENKHADKLSSAHFLKISQYSLLNKEPSKENELVHAFLQRLLTGDYTARHVCVENEANIPNTQRRTKEGAFTALMVKRLNVATERKQAGIHPMDVQMAVFLCADYFLRELMVTKLAQCQYAVPLLVPNPFNGNIEFPFWTIRQINRSWTDASGTIVTKPVYKAETSMVAFFRLGPVSSSKSHLINNLINERHNTFFHRDCKGSSRTRLLMDGVVEMAWYCPSGKKSDHFTESIAFCNLHGDSSRTVTQREILTTMASVNVLLLLKLDENDNNMRIVEELCNSKTPLIVVLTDEENHNGDVCELDGGKYSIGLKGLNQCNVSDILRNAIKNCLSRKHLTFNLEKTCDKLTNDPKVRVDEHNDACQQGKEAAINVIHVLKGNDPLTVKEKYLPCQGTLWHDWCRKSKDLRKLQSHNIELELSKKKREMNIIRGKQRECGFSEFMELFISFLVSLSDDNRKYFLTWTRILLNEFISERLSTIEQEHCKKWTKVLALKKNHDKAEEQANQDKLKAEQLKLEKISKNLNAANFGFEHIIREMSQIYEAWVSEEKNMTEKNLSYLPKLAAELMISGYPMELMDGDTVYVPLVWVSAVLEEVIKILGDQKVFVLSVLGIQSSGKSTMLNAMFGIQFAVSAGRCTKGAFMQLLQVSEDMKKELMFDYILVVDTEGLRSSELYGDIHHDNELSTFVVGLGNMTLINIFGENLIEMQDILQIVVHAFLRMKQVSLKPSCMFVHQNISDIAAKDKIMAGRRHLQETLDKMTKLAAKDAEYYTENFSDVIAFDVERDVKYFAQLWEGSPPMAPPNPRYSENIQELKREILSRAAKTDGLKLSQLQNRVKDLWNALLNENFVFSFKNAQEIAFYRKLERAYGKWTWSLRSAMMSAEDKMLNRVDSGKVETVQKKDLTQEMAGIRENVQQEFNKYFEGNPEKETLSQWKGKFERQIKDLHDDLITEAKRKVDDRIQQKSIRQNVDNQRVIHEKTLFEKSKEHALKLKGNVDGRHAEAQFDAMWKKWVSEIAEQTPELKDVDISRDITDVLEEVYSHDLVYNKKRSEEYKNIVKVSNYSSYVPTIKTQKKMLRFPLWSENFLTPELNKSIRELIIKVTEQTKSRVEKFPFSAQGYSSHYIQSIAHDVKKQVHAFETQFKKEEKLSEDFSVFNQDFYVNLSLYVFGQSTPRITDLQRKYKEANDPIIYFQNERAEYFKIFMKYWQGATSAAILGQQVCSKLKEAVLQSVYNMMAKFVCGQMKGKPPFNGNRADLEKHILMSLAKQSGHKDEKFSNYLTYLTNPQDHFKGFIGTKVEEFMAAENPDAASETQQFIEHKQRTIIRAATTASDQVKGFHNDANKWLEVFSNSLADELGDTRVNVCDEECMNSIDYDVLVEAIRKEMSAVVGELERSLSKLSDFTMEKFRERPDDTLIKHFCRCCWEQCPFCGAVCTNSQQDHSGLHNVDFHRTAGLTGCHYRGKTDFFTDFCTTAVASDGHFYPTKNSKNYFPFKQYRKAGGKYETWGISTDLSELAYWKWFVCEYEKNIEQHHKLKFEGRGEIPAEWRSFSQSDAVKSLGIQ